MRSTKATFGRSGSPLQRAASNPILHPRPENDWESAYVFNPAALFVGGRFHLIYRAIGSAGISVFGYASSKDGIHFDERLNYPVYTHSEFLEFTGEKLQPHFPQSGGSWGGCEDPRLTLIDDVIYMLYTAFDGSAPPCVVLTSIKLDDFMNKAWTWKKPIMISPHGELHKNWVIFPEKIRGKFAVMHSISPNILIEYLDDLDFTHTHFITSHYLASGRDWEWDNWIRGVGPTPLKIPGGWLMLYHAMDKRDPDRYKLGAAILDEHEPTKVLFRASLPLLAPDAPYENEGFKQGVIYCCGAVIQEDILYLYYGGADTVICLAYAKVADVLAKIKNFTYPQAHLNIAQECERSLLNPLLQPMHTQNWQAQAAFNPCVVATADGYVMVYRAISSPEHSSSIGYADSQDGLNFQHHRQLVQAEYDWEKFGCEDPRVTYLEGKFYIFYTALSEYPFTASGIKVALAITRDFKTIDAKHPVTPFNAKAMTLFPEKVNGKFMALLTVNTDSPPPKIALAVFDQESDMWSPEYWHLWYQNLDAHVIPLLRSSGDYIEIGAPPIKTDAGWLIIYSYMRNFYTHQRLFTIEALLLDLHDPSRLIGRTHDPLLTPKANYEIKGDVPNVVFPSGAVIKGNHLMIYYGAADTTGCMAICNVHELLARLQQPEPTEFIPSLFCDPGFQRYAENPILSPQPELAWEGLAVFNTACILLDNRMHLVYRAMSQENVSVLGYASSRDGIHIDERLNFPIYTPRQPFELPAEPGRWYGCEDPRLTQIGNTLHMFYTAYNGITPRVAYTCISVDDFLAKKWNWAEPKVITPAGSADKNACLLPKKIKGQYAILHRPGDSIHISMIDTLDFSKQATIDNGIRIPVQDNISNISKVGIAGPPIEIPQGWLLIYHRVNAERHWYEICAALLDAQDPSRILSTKDVVLMIPEMDYEQMGLVSHVVFSCGAALIQKDVYLYYGGADQVIGVAKMPLDTIVESLR